MIISGGYSVIVVSEVMLMRQLNKFGSLTSDVNVKKMQKEFKTALTALAICPLIFVVAPAMYYVLTGFFRINTPASLSSFVTMMTSSIAVANPIVTIVTGRSSVPSNESCHLKGLPKQDCRRRLPLSFPTSSSFGCSKSFL